MTVFSCLLPDASVERASSQSLPFNHSEPIWCWWDSIPRPLRSDFISQILLFNLTNFLERRRLRLIIRVCICESVGAVSGSSFLGASRAWCTSRWTRCGEQTMMLRMRRTGGRMWGTSWGIRSGTCGGRCSIRCTTRGGGSATSSTTWIRSSTCGGLRTTSSSCSLVVDDDDAVWKTSFCNARWIWGQGCGLRGQSGWHRFGDPLSGFSNWHSL